MNGNNLLTVHFTGLSTLKGEEKNKLSFKISGSTPEWIYDIEKYDTNGNFVQFPMPALLLSPNNHVLIHIISYFGEEEISRSPYLYVRGLAGMYILSLFVLDYFSRDFICRSS